MYGRINNFIKAERGAVAIEFTMVVPVLLIILIATADFGLGFYRKMQVQTASQRAAMYATVKGYNATAISNVITASPGAPASTPAPAKYCGCPGSTGLTVVSCTATCTVAGSSYTPGTYVSASAQATYSPIMPYPGLAGPLNFQSTQVVRIQ